MKKALALLTLLAACVSAPTEVSSDRIDDQLLGLEARLDQERWEPDPSRLQTLQAQARSIASSALLNRDQRLRTHFLLADLAKLQQDRQQLAEQHRFLLAVGNQHPQTLIVSSWLDAANALSILQGAPPPANSHPRLQWELGLLLAKANRHAEAVAAYDQALAGLPEIWRQKGRLTRDTSWNLRHTNVTGSDLNRLATIALPTLNQFYLAVREETPNATALRFETQEPLTRARLAEWVLHYVAEKRNNPDLRNRQSRRIRSRPNPASPIPDVSLEAPYFDAVLFCVERDILPLPDGRNFQPDTRVSGSEAVRLVQRVMKDF